MSYDYEIKGESLIIHAKGVISYDEAKVFNAFHETWKDKSVVGVKYTVLSLELPRRQHLGREGDGRLGKEVQRQHHCGERRNLRFSLRIGLGGRHLQGGGRDFTHRRPQRVGLGPVFLSRG